MDSKSCVVVIAEYTKDGELNIFKINETHNTDESTLEEFRITELNFFKSDRAIELELEYIEDLDDLGFLYDCEIIYLNPL